MFILCQGKICANPLYFNTVIQRWYNIIFTAVGLVNLTYMHILCLNMYAQPVHLQIKNELCFFSVLFNRYKLYGLITHAGVTITSGHYITYVRNLSRVPSVCTNKVQRRTTASTTSKPATSSRTRSTFSSSTVTNGHQVEELTLGQCDPNNNSDQNNNGQCDDINQSVERIDDHVTDYTNQWAECDDDSIRVFSEEEFEELLASERQLIGSPYVLFYHRILE